MADDGNNIIPFPGCGGEPVDPALYLQEIVKFFESRGVPMSEAVVVIRAGDDPPYVFTTSPDLPFNHALLMLGADYLLQRVRYEFFGDVDDEDI